MILEPDTTFGQFKIIRKLGEGGMGEVYLAEDTKLNRQVALKILLSEYFDDDNRRQRFIREAKTAARITHPNVMAIYDMDMAREEKSGKDISYIVMEYIDGSSLTEYIGTKSLPTGELLRLSEKIAAGLAAAHKLGIVHRDIKAENIRLDSDNEPKILDFGLAKLYETDPSDVESESAHTVSQELTQEGKILGTISYISPEQARGEAVDSRSDIFAFGILLYKMFGGKSPFEASDKVSIIAKILEARPTPLRSLNETVPAELDRIIDKCLQKSPADRYQDTRDLVVDLRNLRRQFDSGISDSVALSSSGIGIAPRVKIFNFPVGKIAAALLAIALIIVVILKFGGSSPSSNGGLQAHENILAILGFENKTGDTELDWLGAGLPDMLQTDLSQSSSVNIISRNRILDRLERKPEKIGDPSVRQDVLKAAKELGATKILMGSFFRLGDQIRIDARVEDAETGKILLAEKVVGSNPLDLVDDLTDKIAQSLNIRDVMSQNAQVADLTSASPQAYREYILGMEKYYSNLFDDAIIHFNRSTEEDSTFALPYLRIGMSHALQGRIQAGVPYFVRAKELESHLSQKDRNLLDIYYDMFVENNFAEGFVNLSTFVKNYPEEKEARSFLAIFIYQSKGGKEESRKTALAHLDSILMLDPRYQPALDRIISIYSDIHDYDKAIEYSLKSKEYYPSSPTPYIYLATFYMIKGRYDDAIAECRQLLETHPGYLPALTRIVRACILKRDFDEANHWAGRIKDGHENNNYRMITYYEIVSNLAGWRGQFKAALNARFKELEYGLAENDSSQISTILAGIAAYYWEYRPRDSALHYIRESSKWAVRFQAFDYPLFLIRMDRNRETEARNLWVKAMEYFKASVPPDFWYISDGIGELFENYCQADTAAMIETFKKIMDMPYQGDSEHYYDIGKLLVLSGRFEEGIENLRRLVESEALTSNSFRYMNSLYYLGQGYEALGQNQNAVDCYREILKYWGAADKQLDLVDDTRRRLDRLQS
jgi:tetratricopeptide (TPR) repeat protein/tRNA A-37 threonylcarbamoyl transferase component Bud32